MLYTLSQKISKVSYFDSSKLKEQNCVRLVDHPWYQCLVLILLVNFIVPTEHKVQNKKKYQAKSQWKKEKKKGKAN